MTTKEDAGLPMVPKWIARFTLAPLLVITILVCVGKAQQDYRMNAVESRVANLEAVNAERRLTKLETQGDANDKRLERIENLLIGLVVTVVGQWITTEWRLRQRRRNDDDDAARPARRRGRGEILDLGER